MTLFGYIEKFVEKFDLWIRREDPEAEKKVNNAIKGFITEEYNELLDALKNKDVEEIIDALGDTAWLCIKLMIQVGVDPEKVFQQIGDANLSKICGIKKGREWSDGFDVKKPTQEDVDEGKAEKVFKNPSHRYNHGDLDDILR